ncbi:CrcB family protein [Demequina litorisediminis]|uniref:Fluoride-specific ion channel FluC n=1 Tax=Demequina litorisediminis TaxID=1849022 RepID=A0ABQ6IGB2_9MICO|nr:CrcB family protein [Demequina litorisediminis]GMA36471.1 hypothetical protein GCM10025876_26750 [Demequina litorisediminis]
MSAWAYAAAILACGIGALGRHLLARSLPVTGLAWHTIVANTLAAAVVGAAAGVADAHPAMLLVLGSGIGGGLSTFSTLAVDAARMWEASERRRATLYLALTGTLGILAAWCGWLLTS